VQGLEMAALATLRAGLAVHGFSVELGDYVSVRGADQAGQHHIEMILGNGSRPILLAQLFQHFGNDGAAAGNPAGVVAMGVGIMRRTLVGVPREAV
jgi:hypothetical protein